MSSRGTLRQYMRGVLRKDETRVSGQCLETERAASEVRSDRLSSRDVVRSRERDTQKEPTEELGA